MGLYGNLRDFLLGGKVSTYRYMLRGSGGQELSVRGRLGTLEEATFLAKTSHWVLSYPVKVWCREGQEFPDITLEATGTIEDPALPPKVPFPQ